MRLIALTLGWLLAYAAAAQPVTVSWVLPTDYVDGTPVLPADILSIEVDYGTCAGDFFGSAIGGQTVAGDVTSVNFDLPAGHYCFQAVVATDGHGSRTSDPNFFSLFPPNAPLQVTIL